MTTEPEKPAEPEIQPDGKPGLIETVRSVIADELGKLFASGRADVKDAAEKPAGDPAPGRDRSDVTAAVRAEVAKLREAEAAEAEKKSLAERIKDLEERLAKAAENPPEEFRRITEWMWR